MNQTLRVLTLHRLAVEIGKSPVDVRRAIAELGLPPALELNGTPHFDVASVDRVAEYLQAKEVPRG